MESARRRIVAERGRPCWGCCWRVSRNEIRQSRVCTPTPSRRQYLEQRRRVKTWPRWYFNSRPLSPSWPGSVAKDTCKLTPPSRPLWTLMNINFHPPRFSRCRDHRPIRKQTRHEQIRSFLPCISLLFPRILLDLLHVSSPCFAPSAFDVVQRALPVSHRRLLLINVETVVFG